MQRGLIASVAAAAAIVAPLQAPVAHAQGASSGSDAFVPRGRIQYDMSSVDWDGSPDDGDHSEVRRAFIGAQGRLSPRWRYKVDFIITPVDSSPGVDDAYLQYSGDGWSVFLGEANITSPLEDRTSSLDIPFVERSSVVNAFGYGRRLGVAVLTGGDAWSLAAAVQGDSLSSFEEFSGDGGAAVSARATYAPVRGDGRLVHLGAHARWRDNVEASPFRYRARPFNGRGSRWIDAGAGVGAQGETDISFGVEAVAQFGRFGAQAEYIVLEADTIGGGDSNFGGHYIDLYWSITGETRGYRANQGVFSAAGPERPVNQGGWGHWMLTARYDSIDLSDPDGGAARGEQRAYAIGLDWAPIDRVRFKLNYARSEMDRELGPDEEGEIVSLRTQLHF